MLGAMIKHLQPMETEDLDKITKYNLFMITIPISVPWKHFFKNSELENLEDKYFWYSININVTSTPICVIRRDWG